MRNKDNFKPEQVWKEFYQKYDMTPLSLDHSNHYHRRLSKQEIPAYHQAVVNNATKIKKSADELAVRLQRRWRKKLSLNTLIPINLKANHREKFKELINDNKVLKCINPTKLQQLYQAIQTGNWNDEIFLDQYLPYLALALFDSNKVTSGQMSILGGEVQQGIILLIDHPRSLFQHDIKPTYENRPLLTFELWTLVDAVFLYCYYHDWVYNIPSFRNNLLTAEKVTEKFFNSLLWETNELDLSLFLVKKNKGTDRNITLLGAALILDFLGTPDKWLSNKINFEKLTEHKEVENNKRFKSFYREIKDFYQHIQVYKRIL